CRSVLAARRPFGIQVSVRSARLLGSLGILLRSSCRQFDDEARPARQVVFGPNPPFVIGNNVTDDCQTETGAPAACRERWQKELVAVTTANAVTAVADDLPHGIIDSNIVSCESNQFVGLVCWLLLTVAVLPVRTQRFYCIVD